MYVAVDGTRGGPGRIRHPASGGLGGFGNHRRVGDRRFGGTRNDFGGAQRPYSAGSYADAAACPFAENYLDVVAREPFSLLDLAAMASAVISPAAAKTFQLDRSGKLLSLWL